jgi:hypothetical protein
MPEPQITSSPLHQVSRNGSREARRKRGGPGRKSESRTRQTLRGVVREIRDKPSAASLCSAATKTYARRGAEAQRKHRTEPPSEPCVPVRLRSGQALRLCVRHNSCDFSMLRDSLFQNLRRKTRIEQVAARRTEIRISERAVRGATFVARASCPRCAAQRETRAGAGCPCYGMPLRAHYKRST